MRDTRTRADATWADGKIERRGWRASDGQEQVSEETLLGMPPDAERDDPEAADARLLRATSGGSRKTGKRPQRPTRDGWDGPDTRSRKE